MKLQIEHLEVIADFMQNHKEFARGRLSVSNARAKFKELWTQLAQALNAVGLGEKTVEKWQKSWSDYKGNLKKKAAEAKRYREATGGGPPAKDLTDLENKILEILGTTFFMGIGIEERGLHFSTFSSNNQGQENKINENIMAMPLTSEQVNEREVSEPSAVSTQRVEHEVFQENTKNLQQTKPSEKTNNDPSSSKKRAIDDESIQDHDYLFFKSVKSNKRPKKTDNLNKAYLETIKCLKSIENTVSVGLSNINEAIKQGFQMLNDTIESQRKQH